ITLTEKGENLFPKQYSWFSELLLDKVLAERGAAGLKEWMEGLASTVARDVQAKMTGETLPERLVEISAVMNELAYDASPKPKGTELAIEATNCVYHSVALKHPEVCQFDIQLLGELSGAKVVHEKCMIRGQDVCRFRFDPKKP
ncbi:MAG: helix-turn-helix transcriptional regulator, partial [Bdellovibrionota bacterium]